MINELVSTYGDNHCKSFMQGRKNITRVQVEPKSISVLQEPSNKLSIFLAQVQTIMTHLTSQDSSLAAVSLSVI